MSLVISGGRARQVRAAFPVDPGPKIWHSAGKNFVRLISQPGEFRAVTYEQMYRRQPWVFAVVNKLVMGIARLSVNVYDGVDAETRTRVRGADGNGLPALLTTPFPRASQTRLKVQFLLDLFVQGECLLVPYRPSLGSPPTELWPIPWKYVTTIEDASGIIGYRVMAGGVMATLAPEQVVHVWLPGRVSPLEALARTLALEDASMDLQNATMANGVTPRAVFTAAKLTRNPDDETKLRNELEKLYSGPANGGRFALLGGEWSVDTLGVSAADVALIDQRKLSREEVIGAYGLTSMQMGLSEKAAYASMLEARRAFYVDAVGGAVELVEDELQAQLVAPEPAWDGLYLKFNVDEILRPDPEARARMHLMMQQSGTNAANERRRYEELPPADPTLTDNPYDLPLAPVNMQVPGQTLAAAAPDPAPIPATDPLVTEALRGAPAPLHLDEED